MIVGEHKKEKFYGILDGFGGKKNKNEEIRDTVIRELMEETYVKVSYKDIKFHGVIN